jgi:hypothetical protein
MQLDGDLVAAQGFDGLAISILRLSTWMPRSFKASGDIGHGNGAKKLALFSSPGIKGHPEPLQFFCGGQGGLLVPLLFHGRFFCLLLDLFQAALPSVPPPACGGKDSFWHTLP